MRRKKIIVAGLLAILAILILVIVCDRKISSAAADRHFSNSDALHYNKVGLLLGTSKMIGKKENLYYKYRIDAAYELLNSNKIKYLVISGDNSRIEYNEPAMMKTDLVSRGIDSSRLFLD